MPLQALDLGLGQGLMLLQLWSHHPRPPQAPGTALYALSRMQLSCLPVRCVLQRDQLQQLQKRLHAHLPRQLLQADLDPPVASGAPVLEAAAHQRQGRLPACLALCVPSSTIPGCHDAPSVIIPWDRDLAGQPHQPHQLHRHAQRRRLLQLRVLAWAPQLLAACAATRCVATRAAKRATRPRWACAPAASACSARALGTMSTTTRHTLTAATGTTPLASASASAEGQGSVQRLRRWQQAS